MIFEFKSRRQLKRENEEMRKQLLQIQKAIHCDKFFAKDIRVKATYNEVQNKKIEQMIVDKVMDNADVRRFEDGVCVEFYMIAKKY